MNAVEIEEALSQLAEAPFDADTFPFAFLEAFGNKQTTLNRLKSHGRDSTNKSDLPTAVLQRNQIHLATCPSGQVSATLDALRQSKATSQHKVKFILATDGQTVEAESLLDDDQPIICDYPDLHNYLGFFLPLAGITTVKQIQESSVDIKATGRLNRLYLELLRTNPDWASAERREAMNHFMARLIFCFFAEDTNIFHGEALFTRTIEQMSDRDGRNLSFVLEQLFLAMQLPPDQRPHAQLRNWANTFPYVNGGLFSGDTRVPHFTRLARTYLLHIGRLDWTRINPDIFGSMIQAITDEEERSSLGMHYTSVPNILKLLNPLFLDDLRAQLAEAGSNGRKLLNLRQRLSRIRVFDPACGSGNFLVIAYKEMRAIEAEINQRRNEADKASLIPLTNFRGIELRHFSAEIARLALIIAEYQCDVRYRGPQLALAEFLPLKDENWIICGNALRLDWLTICPPTGTAVKLTGLGLFDVPTEQAQIEFENEGGETYICGNPPYVGSTWQSAEQKDDLKQIFDGKTKQWKSLDYVAGWFMKAAEYGTHTQTASAFVSTNSICQGQQVSILWPLIFATEHQISFAHTSFKWANLASHNAGVTVVIVGIAREAGKSRRLYSLDEQGQAMMLETAHINAYLVSGPNIIVSSRSQAYDERGHMEWGNKATDGGNLLFSMDERNNLIAQYPEAVKFIKQFVGSQEFIRGQQRFCLWINDDEAEEAAQIPPIAKRIESVRVMRASSKAAETRPASAFPHRFRQIQSTAKYYSIVVPGVSSENREYLPVGVVDGNTIISNRNFALYDAPLWNMALIASRLHWVWAGTVCLRLRTDFSYSNTLGWNTFPVPPLTQQYKTWLTEAAESILLAREHYFPATIADMYDPAHMDKSYPLLRQAHEHNDEIVERIYIGRRFKNDTERLETLFERYSQLTRQKGKP